MNETLFKTLVQAYLPLDYQDRNYFMIHDGTIRVWQDYGYKTITEIAPHHISCKIIPYMTYVDGKVIINKFHPLALMRENKHLQNSVTEFGKLVLSIPCSTGIWLIKFLKVN